MKRKIVNPDPQEKKSQKIIEKIQKKEIKEQILEEEIKKKEKS